MKPFKYESSSFWTINETPKSIYLLFAYPYHWFRQPFKRTGRARRLWRVSLWRKSEAWVISSLILVGHSFFRECQRVLYYVLLWYAYRIQVLLALLYYLYWLNCFYEEVPFSWALSDNIQSVGRGSCLVSLLNPHESTHLVPCIAIPSKNYYDCIEIFLPFPGNTSISNGNSFTYVRKAGQLSKYQLLKRI